MNKEVKAIVEYLNEEKEAIRKGFYYPNDVLSYEDLTTIIDYINQLEEDKKDLLFKKELLKSEIYEDTTSMDKVENEFNLLKQKVNQLETNRDEVIRYIKAYKPSDVEFNAKEILSILERGKE